ncbi:hypothetical protein CEXT_55731 [Caerostris extrusa]|uniref:Uncharacterized protein n=1 Tax=Caerostris extrusa TaxID=172846 RepID=A0AAV4WH87_CAEEX|nr:hypothetical protein CEXT_55731 [Caerostris extrusa]
MQHPPEVSQHKQIERRTISSKVESLPVYLWFIEGNDSSAYEIWKHTLQKSSRKGFTSMIPSKHQIRGRAVCRRCTQSTMAALNPGSLVRTTKGGMLTTTNKRSSHRGGTHCCIVTKKEK